MMILRTWLLAILSIITLAGCTDDNANQGKKRPRPAQLVELFTVQSESVQHSTKRTGSLQAISKVELFNQEEGALTELAFHEGAQVNKGDVLARIDDKLLRAELDKAQASLRQAEQDLARLKKLRGKRLVAEDELARAKTALDLAKADARLLQTRFSYTQMRAPIAGIISKRLAEPGLVVKKHTHLLTLIDTSTLITEVAVSELLLPSLSIDDDVEVSIDALPNKSFMGKILRIHPSLNVATRTGIVEIILQPAPQGAIPGQLCRVSLQSPAQTRLLIPFSALRRDQEGEFIFRVNNRNKAIRTSVRSGLRIKQKIEILEGLNDGQQIVVKGFLGLKHGKSIRTAMRKSVAK